MSLLENALLRRLAKPLRQSAPRLYRALNDVRGRLIRGTSALTPYQTLAFRRFRDRCLAPDPRANDVLELGSDVRMALLDEIAGLGVRSAIGVNPSPSLWQDRVETELRSPRGGRLLKGDARRLAFPDQSFDRVFSVAALEHILELPVALAEMRRVLRPGGMVYASFGPIWSGAKGHHINARAGDVVLHHADPRRNPLPDFSHLLLSPDEMRAAIARTHGKEMGDAVVEWIWRSSDINRLFFHEYLRAFAASGLELVSLVPAVDPVPPELERILRFRYPDETRFDVTNAEVILRRPSSTR